MKTALILFTTALLTGCASSAESVLDRLEFEEGQEGCIRATGQVQVGGNPFASSSLNVNLVKMQGDAPPEC